ncbi:MAG: kelch repeat-containing protein [Ignavibacteria bacterium]|jgi:N-acetylneuraminic acid mutarotase
MKKLLLLILFFYSCIKAQFGEWIIEGEMPIPVAGAEAVAYNGKIFILGGYNDSSQTTVNLIQMFDLLMGDWQIVGEMLTPRMDFVADVYNDGICYFGSIENDSSEIPPPLEFWQFNTDAGSLNYGNDLRNNYNFGRTASTGLIYNDQFFIFGGQVDNTDGNSESVYSIIQYHIPSSIVINGTNPENLAVKFPTHQMSKISADDIYIFGGVFNGVSNSIYRFNTADFSFEIADTELTTPRADGVAVKAYDGSILLIGGFNEGTTAMQKVERFYPSSFFGGSDLVESMPEELNIARTNCMAVSYEDRIYVFGGFGLDGFVVNEIEVFSLGAATDIEDASPISDKIHLYQNYPNPFNPQTNIKFVLNEAVHVSLKIYSMNGEEIKTITDKVLQPGYYEYLWDGTDNKGRQVASGVYIYRLAGANYSQQKKMLLLR